MIGINSLPSGLKPQQRAEELERLNELAVCREQQMIELKHEVNAVSIESGISSVYDDHCSAEEAVG